MDARGILSVMMPIFNEERTLEIILGHVLEQPEVGEGIAVDDASTDRSWEVLIHIAKSDKRVRALRQETNHRKGAALRHAITELRIPFALVHDAALHYAPRDSLVLLPPL